MLSDRDLMNSRRHFPSARTKIPAGLTAVGYELEKNVSASFLDESFKKKDGFRRSVELSKEYGIYRQNYCGCVFSKRD